LLTSTIIGAGFDCSVDGGAQPTIVKGNASRIEPTRQAVNDFMIVSLSF
jgi:hypothetical protein